MSAIGNQIEALKKATKDIIDQRELMEIARSGMERYRKAEEIADLQHREIVELKSMIDPEMGEVLTSLLANIAINNEMHRDLKEELAKENEAYEEGTRKSTESTKKRKKV